MNTFNIPADQTTLTKTVEALKAKGYGVTVVKTAAEAKTAVLSLIPEGSEVMTMTSVTLDTIGATAELNSQEGKYTPVRDRLYAMDKATHEQEMNKLGAAPEYAVGSVHAVTQDGSVLIASNTGSQLPAYAYSALHVVWVIGTQKIVKDIDEGMRRIYEYSLPLEGERAAKAYGTAGSAVNKLLIINQENKQNHIQIVFIEENIGF
jgi:hypothetical protein